MVHSARQAGILSPQDYNEECTISRTTWKELADSNDLVETVCRHRFSHDMLGLNFNLSVKCPNCRHDLQNTPLRQVTLEGQQIDKAKETVQIVGAAAIGYEHPDPFLLLADEEERRAQRAEPIDLQVLVVVEPIRPAIGAAAPVATVIHDNGQELFVVQPIR